MHIDPLDIIEVTTLPVRLLDILSLHKLIDSKSEGKRLLAEGAITIDGEKVTDKDYVIEKLPLQGVHIMRSRRRRLRLQEAFLDDVRWNNKIQVNGRSDFEIEFVIQAVAQDLEGDD